MRRQVVTERFAEANMLFVLDQLVKGAIGAITGLIGGIAAFLPIPGLQGLVSFVNTVIRLSLTYVDEIILGYNIRLDSRNPFETGAARRGALRPERQDHGQERRLAVAHHVGAGVPGVPLHARACRARSSTAMPGALAGWSFVLAIIFAWAVKSALVEPFVHRRADAGLFQGHRGPGARSRLGPPPRRGLKHFRELKDKALGSFGGARPAPGRSRADDTGRKAC